MYRKIKDVLNVTPCKQREYWVLTVLLPLLLLWSFPVWLLFGFLDITKYCQFYCLTERFPCYLLAYPLYESAWCPVSLLPGLSFLFWWPDCTDVWVWIKRQRLTLVYADGFDCYFGFDPLPVLMFLFMKSAVNKFPHMDSNSCLNLIVTEYFATSESSRFRICKRRLLIKIGY